jgi:hypothetical protein
MKKLTVQEINSRVFKVHGDKIVLVDTTYIGTNKKAKFIDKIYGEFWCKPCHVMAGTVSGKEGNLKKAKSQTLSLEEVKERILKIHGENVKIVENTYKKVGATATFIDKDYGKWKTSVHHVLNGKVHKDRAIKTNTLKMVLSLEEIKKRIFDVHGDVVEIIENTYVSFYNEAWFVDKLHGKWKSTPANIISGSGHRNRTSEKRKNTFIKRYGVEYNQQILEVALQTARSQAKSTIKFHWKTEEELVCQAGWEPKVVDYLNINQINYDWQPRVFEIPDGKTYRPDFYLIDRDVWVEIKK